MATAKQLAARKRFTAIMKSGGFPAQKKAAAARKKNPVRKAPARKTVARKRNPMPAPPPSAERRRTLNPAHRAPSGYAVHLVNAYQQPGKLLATFTTKPLAVEYANGYANKHKKAVCIVGKK